MNHEIQKTTSEIIQRNFDLDEIHADKNILEKIREQLIVKIDFLLNHDYEKLLSILYRIDVDEKKAMSTLAGVPAKNPSEVLADLIIERQIEKLKSRYTHLQNDIPDDLSW